MAISKTIRIDDTDVTSEVAAPYSVAYKKITGQNGGYMQDGSMVQDIRAVKVVLRIRPQPLTGSAAGRWAGYLESETVKVYYYDPQHGYKTIYCIPSESAIQYNGTNDIGNDIWTISELTLTER